MIKLMPLINCNICNGEGRIRCPRCRGKGAITYGFKKEQNKTCYKCKGEGFIKCENCRGIGIVEVNS